MMNEEIAIVYSKRCVAQAASLFWRKRSWSIGSIVFRSVISLFLVFSVACQKEKIPVGEFIALFILLVLTWGTSIFFYFIFLVRLLSQMRPTLGRTIKCVLTDDRISMSSDRGMRETFWSDLDMYAKSSEVTLFYSSKTKILFIFPNAILSERVQAYMLERFERLKPPILAGASSINKKYMTMIIVIVVLVVWALLHYDYSHTLRNDSMETNNVSQH